MFCIMNGKSRKIRWKKQDIFFLVTDEQSRNIPRRENLRKTA